VPVRHWKSIALYSASAKPFSDTHTCIPRETGCYTQHVVLATPFFFIALHTCDRFSHVSRTCSKIDSQTRTDTALDWRRNQEVNIYSTWTVDEITAAMVRRFIDLSGLRFAVLDLIVDREGNIQFLECNPAGQWLWIEQFTGLPISVAVAHALANHSSSRSKV
jgi:hypothetical protein